MPGHDICEVPAKAPGIAPGQDTGRQVSPGIAPGHDACEVPPALGNQATTGCQVSPGIVPGHDICEVPGWWRSFSLAKFRAGGPGPRQVKEGGAELCPGATLLEGEEGTSPLGAASRATNVKPRRPRSTSTALWATAEQGTKHPPLRVPPANCIGLPPHLVLVLSRQTSRTGLRVSPVTWDGKLRQ